MPLVVPAKDGFCRALRGAVNFAHSTPTAKAGGQPQQAAEQEQQAGFSLGRFARRLAKPVKAHVGAGSKGGPRRQLAQADLQDSFRYAPAPAPAYYDQRSAAVQPSGGTDVSNQAGTQQQAQQQQAGGP